MCVAAGLARCGRRAATAADMGMATLVFFKGSISSRSVEKVMEKATRYYCREIANP